MSTFLKSTLISNRDATPKVLTDSYLSGGIMEEVMGSVKTGSSDPAGNFYRLVQVPSNARVSQIYWQTDTILSNSCRLDLGVWYPTTVPVGGANFIPSACAGTFIGTSFFANGLNPSAAIIALTEITNNSSNYLVPLQETPLWNVLGFLTDPEISFDMGFSVNVANSVAGYVGLKVRYQY
jgi:hypothetical protein